MGIKDTLKIVLALEKGARVRGILNGFGDLISRLRMSDARELGRIRIDIELARPDTLDEGRSRHYQERVDALVRELIDAEMETTLIIHQFASVGSP